MTTIPPIPQDVWNTVAYAKIFPPIGIARIGDSGFDLDIGEPDGDIEYFFPSEVPGDNSPPLELQGQFRDNEGRIKRQAARFRVYGYNANNQIIAELNNSTGFMLTWTVHVANKKASYFEFTGKYEPSPKYLRNPDVQSDLKPDGRSKLIVDSGVQTISLGDSPINLVGGFYGSQEQANEVCLGQIRTDNAGRLVFIGGAGYSRCVADPQKPHFQPDIISEFDSIDWIDDICDGWVDVEVIPIGWPNTGFGGGGMTRPLHALQKATIITAPPRFAWGIRAPTTLYDVMESIYAKEMGWVDHSRAQFYKDIWPVLYGTFSLSWVNEKAYQGHGPLGHGNFSPLEGQLRDKGSEDSKHLRHFILQRLRRPDYEDPAQASTKYMPRLSGDNGDAFEPAEPVTSKNPIQSFASLTDLQYQRFSDWAEGKFSTDKFPSGNFTRIEDVPLYLQPSYLTRSVLENTIGDPLFPGIEVHWCAKLRDTYLFDPGPFIVGEETTVITAGIGARPMRLPNIDPPFRINHHKIKPGDLTRGLSLPWQSDFSQCNTHWWPSARPDDVITVRGWNSGAKHEKKISKESFTRFVAPQRRKWTRGMRDTPDFPSEYFPGCTDMVRSWQNLGFVSKQDKLAITDSEMGSELSVWLEQERMPISSQNQQMYEWPGID